MPTRSASATWNGGLKNGSGSFSIPNGLSSAFNFGSRFQNEAGSNPEELLAAAEASCFSMALSGALEKNGTVASSINTTARCTVEKAGDGFAITTMDLDVRVAASGLDQATLDKLATETKSGCPVSKALANNVKLSVKATLQSP
jgi:osmotically inducible protein OsmC